MKHLLIVAAAFYPFLCFAQDLPSSGYPVGYFRNPLDIPIKLAANFGELRANHYHMGLDIRTQQKENLPVMAAADGYIAKVVIEPAGFGQAIYIRHPNGYTTLYAHLNKFFPALAAYVSGWQYRTESWQASIDIPADLFPVKKGELIAYSGNTGGSQGPHLHFEIRRTADDTNLNPLLFGMPVPDNVPPVILRLAIYDRSLSTYEQSPQMWPVIRTSEGGFRLKDSLVVVTASRVSFAISAFDSQSGSANPNGIFQASLQEDGVLLTAFEMNNISYNDTRKINGHVDYRTKEKGGPWLQHLSRLPGQNAPCIYQTVAVAAAAPDFAHRLTRPATDGVIDLSDGIPHAIRITVKDAAGNTTVLHFQVQYRPSPVVSIISSPLAGKVFFPGMLDGYEAEGVAFYVSEKALYDSVHIGCSIIDSAPGRPSPVYAIGSTVIPLQEPLLVRIRSARVSKDRVVMLRKEGIKKEAVRPEWLGDWASARFREFGDFCLVEDKLPPVITPIGIRDGAVLRKVSRIAFRVKDDLGGIRGFRAELDPPADGPGGKGGHWLCFTNDKYLDFIYILDGHCPAGKHVLKVTAEDVAGNRTIKEYRFTR
ncbi:M23 family metallopeptidase [Flavitalea sp. BT771]|uniref:M23 family metallopeptidase n=1 Tax=Flavitalea sp. BT771 TaxID=3063329 RepID=UPI0026E2F3EF|nr:M23 family metallopeptidase [Flavitalea sp. BT771]MDO6434129.1 M23 family metallopeptidase [Flavitalea sp. BT771]MDV6223029.1 M23 family metallopeptidase [Flavitalea sp. BT771]